MEGAESKLEPPEACEPLLDLGVNDEAHPVALATHDPERLLEERIEQSRRSAEACQQTAPAADAQVDCDRMAQGAPDAQVPTPFLAEHVLHDVTNRIHALERALRLRFDVPLHSAHDEGNRRGHRRHQSHKDPELLLDHRAYIGRSAAAVKRI